MNINFSAFTAFTNHIVFTLPETNIAHENPIFPGKYHQNCGFSMAMLVSGSVRNLSDFLHLSEFRIQGFSPQAAKWTRQGAFTPRLKAT